MMSHTATPHTTNETLTDVSDDREAVRSRNKSVLESFICFPSFHRKPTSTTITLTSIMENHTFSDPVPVKDASSSSSSTSPTWKVDVIRLRGSVLVGTLLVNNETLPPRKNKKRIAWRLPDDPEALPKFGEHERKRLWELFKEQKKQRRRQSKKLSTQLSADDYEDDDEEETERDTEEPATATGSANDYSGGAPKAEKENGAPKNDSPLLPSSSPPPPDSSSKEYSLPPPPPGFHLEKMALNDNKQEVSVVKEDVPAAAAPPPSAPPLHTSSLTPPPGLAPTLPDSPLPPTLYFTLADDKPLAALGGLVVPLFLQCVTTSTVVPWLAHSHPTLSQTTLSLGSAQATARTYLDRLQQWQSLTLSTSWDCTGCVSQQLPTSGSPPTVLLVLTGRTIQQTQECLAYHLSIVLTAAVNTRNFQITNECLSLTALTNVPFPT